PGDDAVLGEMEVAGDTEHRRLADLVREARPRLERGIGLRREHDQVDVPDDVLVGAAFDADLERPFPGALRLARADPDLLAEQVQAPRQRAAELGGAADDRDLPRSAPAVSSTASATRRRPSASSISVRVTIVLMPASSSASASSITSASIRSL